MNVERLEAYKARLVVFPRKAGKAKKGDTADADLKADYAANLASLPIPKAAAAEAPRAITAEEKSAKSAYRTLRDARSEQRYAGAKAAREKKRAEEEEAKKK